MKGIDVSYAQGTIDWEKVKAAGIEFAMIRAGYGKDRSNNQVDNQFKNNIEGAKKNGIKVGVYWYSYATSEENAVLEAEYCLDTIKGYEIDFPVAFDIEDKKISDLSTKEATAICKAFCNKIKSAGYYPIFYTNPNWLRNELYEDEVLKEFPLWLAQWSSSKSYDCQIWQYSSSGKVNGINGNVDMDECFVDYERLIKAKGLNGFKVVENSTQNNNSTIHYITYTVKKGDTLWDIAKKYLGHGNKYTEIKKINNLKSDIISTGQKLKIPKASSLENNTIIYTVKKGDTLWKIAEKYFGNGLEYPRIISENNLKTSTITIGQKLKIPK